MEYQKPYKTFLAQVDLWVSRGLIINSPAIAEQTFARLNYYRLSAYALPFQKEKDHFNSGTDWEDITGLYEFDRKLRLLIFSYLETIEVAIRTAICHYLAEKFGSFGYADAANFHTSFPHNEWYSKLKEEQARSKETFINHYRKKYFDSPDLPIWMAAEIMTFGSVSKLFQGMNFTDQKNIARIYGLPAPVFASWLHFLTYIRNLCAHHCRIWNRELAIRPKFPDKMPFWSETRNDRIISFFVVSQFLFHKIHIEKNISESLEKLFREYPQISLVSMGFKPEWRAQSVWEAS